MFSYILSQFFSIDYFYRVHLLRATNQNVGVEGNIEITCFELNVCYLYLGDTAKSRIILNLENKKRKVNQEWI